MAYQNDVVENAIADDIVGRREGFILLLRQKNNALTPEISPTVDGCAVEEANETLETYFSLTIRKKKTTFLTIRRPL